MIEQISPVIVGGRLIARERAVLDCGCSCYIGVLLSNQEASAGGVACSPDHSLLMHRHNLLMKESTVEPQHGRPLVEVADELLSTAAGMEAPR